MATKRKSSLPTMADIEEFFVKKDAVPTTAEDAAEMHRELMGLGKDAKVSKDATGLWLTAAREFVLAQGGDTDDMEAVGREVGGKPARATAKPKSKDAAKKAAKIAKAIEEDDEDIDEQERSVGVVPAKYKEQYRARGRKMDCGDELAVFLEARKLEAKTEAEWHEDYLAILDANAVDASSYDRTNRGWFGRLRMSTGITLRRTVAKQGTLKMPKGLKAQFKPSAAFIAKNTPKPKSKGGMSDETRAKLRAAAAAKKAGKGKPAQAKPAPKSKAPAAGAPVAKVTGKRSKAQVAAEAASVAALNKKAEKTIGKGAKWGQKSAQ
jgi:hypothetical protein